MPPLSSPFPRTAGRNRYPCQISWARPPDSAAITANHRLLSYHSGRESSTANHVCGSGLIFRLRHIMPLSSVIGLGQLHSPPLKLCILQRNAQFPLHINVDLCSGKSSGTHRRPAQLSAHTAISPTAELLSSLCLLLCRKHYFPRKRGRGTVFL